MTGAGNHALVIGASISGLLAARALADHYDHVTVLERDPLPDGPVPRRGTPQDRHAHALLRSGLDALDRFFPGIRADLAARGASQNDMLASGRWFLGGGWHVRFDSGLIGSVQSRPLLEATIRERLLALPNVTLRANARVEGLVTDDARREVQGVRLRPREGEGATALTTDLVVDASGRGSRGPAWLEALGYARPAEEAIRIDLAYATRVYRRTPGDLGGATGLVIGAEPPDTRGGVVIPLEGDRWIVTLAGTLGDHPPTDPDGFLAFAESLARPDVADLIRRAASLSEVALIRFPANLRRRYERLERFPEGYLVVGDALCSFNPVYGQGMTVAALEAAALHACLERGRARLARRFFTRAAAIVDTPWRIAVGADLRHPEVEGRRTVAGRFVNWYLGRVHRAAHRDPAVCLAFHRVTNLLAPPASVFAPRVVWGVMRWSHRSVTGIRGGAGVPTSPG